MNVISDEGTTKVGLAVNVEGFQCLVQRASRLYPHSEQCLSPMVRIVSCCLLTLRVHFNQCTYQLLAHSAMLGGLLAQTGEDGIGVCARKGECQQPNQLLKVAA